MKGISRGENICEQEILSTHERYHDYLITSLRTKWGADPSHIQAHFGDAFRKHFEQKAKPFLEDGTLWKTGNKTGNDAGDKTGGEIGGNTAIHPNHWLITDHILRELFKD